jgi:hypothetical protein
MLLAERLAVGTGAAAKSDSREIVDRWRRAADPADRSPRALSPPDMAAIGIGYHIEETKP